MEEKKSQSDKEKGKVRRESFYEDHHLFVSDNLKKHAQELISDFDASKFMIDQLLLSRILGFSDMRGALLELGFSD